MSTALGRGLSPVRTVLDSGAVVLVQENATTPAVTILATFLGGSVYEPAVAKGLAHLTGRVLDRGTERRPSQVIAEQLDDRGVSLKLSTTRHTLSISCTCLAEDFDDVLAIALDVAQRPVFPVPEIDQRRAEILTALRQDDDNPSVRAVEALFELLYGEEHPYAHKAKGTPSILDQLRREDLVAFHAARIKPSTLTLTIVGDVREDHALRRAELELLGWDGQVSDEVLVLPPSPAVQRLVRDIEMPGKAQTEIAYGFTTIRRLDPRFYAYWVMNNILGQFGLGGRLADNIRERQGMAYYAFSAFDPSVAEGPLIVRAGVDPANVTRALEAIDDEVRRMCADGPTAAELEESREYLIGSIARMFETNQSIAAFLQNAEQFGLGLDYDRNLPRHLQVVTLEQVAAAAREVLHPDRAAVALAGPPRQQS